MTRTLPTILGLAMLLSLPGPSHAGSSYAGSAACSDCHEDVQGKFAKTTHGKLFNQDNALSSRMKLGCEACHGPAQAHVEAGGGKAQGEMLSFRAENSQGIEGENAACLGCHAGGAQLYWKGSDHDSRGLACTSCHSSHQPQSERHQLLGHDQGETCSSCHLIQRSRQQRRSRMPLSEGHMDCSSCHNPHGAVGQSMIEHVTINDNCLSCHADKRGPFMWEHAPVTESCLSCHTPHGSSKRAMLRLDQPRLCQQCHVASRHPSQPRSDDPADRFVVGGACLNCHINIHGSNHPAGFVFSR